MLEGDVCENIDTFNFERHDAFAFVVLGIFVLRGSLPYDDDASSSRLLDPQYVQFCVEAALEADGQSVYLRVWRQSAGCLHRSVYLVMSCAVWSCFFVRTCVDISPGFRDCLADLYRAVRLITSPCIRRHFCFLVRSAHPLGVPVLRDRRRTSNILNDGWPK